MHLQAPRKCCKQKQKQYKNDPIGLAFGGASPIDHDSAEVSAFGTGTCCHVSFLARKWAPVARSMMNFTWKTKGAERSK